MEPQDGELSLELCAGVRAGHPKACEEFFRMIAPSALRVARRMVGDLHAAEDVVQDAFTTVFEKGRELRDPSTLRSWFFAVLMNRCREYRRWKAIRDVPLERRVSHSQGSGIDVDNVIQDVLRKVPEVDQILFERVLVQREPYEQVASELGITVEVVRTRVYRLRRLLRDEMQPLLMRGEGTP